MYVSRWFFKIFLIYFLLINFLGLNIPVELKQAIMAKHGNNFIEHRRFESFNKPNESFEDCDKRLIKELVDKTGLPIYK